MSQIRVTIVFFKNYDLVIIKILKMNMNITTVINNLSVIKYDLQLGRVYAASKARLGFITYVKNLMFFFYFTKFDKG